MKRVSTSKVQGFSSVVISATGRRTQQTKKTGIIKQKRIACPSACTTGISKPTKRKTTRPRVGNEWGKILV